MAGLAALGKSSGSPIEARVLARFLLKAPKKTPSNRLPLSGSEPPNVRFQEMVPRVFRRDNSLGWSSREVPQKNVDGAARIHIRSAIVRQSTSCVGFKIAKKAVVRRLTPK